MRNPNNNGLCDHTLKHTAKIRFHRHIKYRCFRPTFAACRNKFPQVSQRHIFKSDGVLYKIPDMIKSFAFLCTPAVRCAVIERTG